jgi:hypothetical protein
VSARRLLGEILVGTAAFAFILGVFGPSLDPDARYDRYAPTQTGDGALIEAEARHACAANPEDQAGQVIDAHGAVVCTDKHGRRHRNVITIAEKVAR